MCWSTTRVIIINSPLVDTSGERWVEDWDTTIMVNLTASGILCRAAITHFMEHNGGRIINIASRAAFRGDEPEYLAYAASKGGNGCHEPFDRPCLRGI